MSEKLVKDSLRERVGGILRAQIMTGDLVPGVIYSVGQFSEKLGVSPTPVREAVLDLEHSGLVEIQKNRGFLVPKVTQPELEELHKIRSLLEVPSTVEAAEKMDEGILDSLVEIANETVEAASSGDLVAYVDTDRRFHYAFLAPLKMSHLTDLIMAYRDRTRLRALPNLIGGSELIASSKDHLAMVNAVRKRDFDELESIIAKHIDDTKLRWAYDQA